MCVNVIVGVIYQPVVSSTNEINHHMNGNVVVYIL